MCGILFLPPFLFEGLLASFLVFTLAFVLLPFVCHDFAFPVVLHRVLILLALLI